MWSVGSGERYRPRTEANGKLVTESGLVLRAGRASSRRYVLHPDRSHGWLRRARSGGSVCIRTPSDAETERDGSEHGLAALEAIVGMERSQLWHAALADNLRRVGRAAEAAGELETAAAWAPAEGERRLLVSGLLDVRPGPA
jgi:hypothetical protein